MRDIDVIELLQWALPRLGLQWHGFRRVHGQVVQRIRRRCVALGVDAAGYRARLEADAGEWPLLDEMCRVTISRFARDRAVWDQLFATELPRLAREANPVRAWSAACGAGEEPYTLSIGCAHAGIAIDILATDTHAYQLERAAAAAYPTGTLRELPAAWRDAFEIAGDRARLRPEHRASVTFANHDLRTPRAGTFDLVLCRNAAFTYFGDVLQRTVAAMLRDVMRPGAVLVLGKGEVLPDDSGFDALGPCLHARRAR